MHSTPSCALLRSTFLRIAGAWALTIAAWQPGSAEAQSVTVHMEASAVEVPVGTPFILQLEISAEGARIDSIREPDLQGLGLEILQRRHTQPSSFSFSFGGRSQYVSMKRIVSYQVRSNQPGTLVIPPVTARVGGAEFQSEPLRLTILGDPAKPATEDTFTAKTSQNAEPQSKRDRPAAVSSDFDPQGFIRTEVDIGDPFVGEQTTMTVTLFAAVPLFDPSLLREPTADGFWTQDLLGPNHRQALRETVVQGRKFYAVTLKKWALFPLREGPLTIRGVEIRYGDRSTFPPGTRTTRGEDLTIVAKPLPQTTSTKVVVGRFTISSQLDRNQAPTGDAVTLTAQVRAIRGNVRDARLSLPVRDGLRILEPEVHHEITRDGESVGGTSKWTWLVVPEREGTYVFEPFELSVFDPDSGTFSAVAGDRLELLAVGADLTSPPEDTESETPERATRASSTNFGPVRTETSFERSSSRLIEASWFVPALVLGPMLLLSITGWRSLHGWLQSRRQEIKKRETELIRIAERHMQQAEKYMEQAKKRAASSQNSPISEDHDTGQFYRELTLGILRTVESKLGEPFLGALRSELRTRLLEAKMEATLTLQLVEDLEHMEQARFSLHEFNFEAQQALMQRAKVYVQAVRALDVGTAPASLTASAGG
ncbi:MAG: BatD family protein [Myxococcota bacterium]